MSQKRILKSVGVISGATIVSRVLGLIRDLGSAWIFGTGFIWDAFVGAFMLPNLVRRIFGEGALNAAFVPVFSEYIQKRSKKDIWELACIVISIVSMILVFLVIVVLSGIFFLRLLCDFSPKTDLLLRLLYVLFPYVIFICLAAVFMGILNSLRHFTVPALFPIVLNVFWIAALLYAWKRGDWGMEAKIWIVSAGILIAGFFQAGMQIPVLKKKGMSFRFCLDWRHPGLIRIFRLFVPVIIGTAIIPINVFITRVIAHFLGVGIQSSLYFSERLIQLPLGIAAIPMAQVILPEMARHAAQSNIDEVRRTFSFGLRSVLFITMPMMAGLIFLNTPIIQAIFQHGAFDSESTRLTARAMMFYAYGLFAYASIRILTPVFYAMQDTKKPMVIAFLSMLLNITIALSLVGRMGGGGLALAMSASSMCQACVLFYCLRKKIGFLDGKRIFASGLKIAALSTAMGYICLWFYNFVLSKYVSIIPQFVVLLLSVLLGILIYLIVAWFSGIKEARELYYAFVAKKTNNV